MSDPSDPFGDGTLLDDMAAEFPDPATAPAPKTTDLSAIRLDGDNVPAEFRGKSVETMMETMRLMMEQRNAPPPVVTAPTPTPEAPLPQYDKAAIQAMIDSGDTLSAIEAAVGFGYARATRELEARLAPLHSAGASVFENAARAKYADEFELFEQEIKQISAAAGPALSQPGAWDNLIAYVRGRDGNIDKLIDHKARKRSRVPSDDIAPLVGSRRSGNSPFSIPGRKPTKDELASDDRVKKVLEASGMSLDEYVRYYVD